MTILECCLVNYCSFSFPPDSRSSTATTTLFQYSVVIIVIQEPHIVPTHCNLVIQIFSYLSGTLDLGTTFTADSEDDLVGYTDSDYAGLVDDRKSTGGYIFLGSD